ncbi:ATP-binding protein [Marmoricola sp. URHA0025 HA25]
MVHMASTRSRGSAPRRPWLRAACAALLFLLFGFLSQATAVADQRANGVWAAAGIGALWLASGSRRTWPADAVALAGATATVNVVAGASTVTVVVFTVANLVQVGVYVVLARRWTGRLWGRDAEPLHRLADLGRLAAVSLSAGFVGAAAAATGLVLAADPPDTGAFLLWWGRNGVTMLVFPLLALLAWPGLSKAGGWRDLVAIVVRALRPSSLSRLVESCLLVGTSVAVYGVLFGHREAQPLAFLVLAMSVWAGLRFAPLPVMLHGMAAGATGLVFTLHGAGPFAGIESDVYRALVAQLFIATCVLTGLALAFSRLERDEANGRLAETQREADERARLLGAVLESMNEGLVVVEEGGRVLVSNAASRELLGLDAVRDRLRPAREYALFHEDGTPLSDEDLPQLLALRGEDVAPQDFHLRTESVPQGRVLQISASPVPSVGPDDRPRGMVNIRDVTLERQHRDGLASFAGVVAHDLYNPLTLVSGWAEALEQELTGGSLSPSVGLPMVNRLRDATDRMREIIGDLLDYTVARDQSLRPAWVDLTAELRALALLRIDGPGNPLITVGPDLELWADVGLVRQLFDNLLGNAVKYVAPATRPRVDIRGRRDGAWLEVRVSDNGIGIPEEEREQVFETFHRAHRQGYQGTGLGLAICRRIAERHGGSIVAEAGPRGVGSTFVVRLPADAGGYARGRFPDRTSTARTEEPVDAL